MKAVSNSTTSKTGKIRLDNEAKIRAAAVDEFAERGFRGASMHRIATQAGIPRTNVHYYFPSKLDLFVSILTGIIDLWNEAFQQITPADDPAIAISSYIRVKINYSKTNAKASKIFAREIINGAPNLSTYLNKDFRLWLRETTQVIQHWIDNGKMDPVDPFYLIFLIWGATQHYADFEVQVCSGLDKKKLAVQDYEDITNNLTHIILKGCGIKMTNSFLPD